MRWNARMGIIAILLMLVISAMVPAASSLGNDAVMSSSSRAFDNDPDNEEPWGATTFANGEVVQGSIMVNQSDDVLDWYVIKAYAGTVVNASLFMIDHNPMDPGEYNLQLLLARFQGPDLEIVDEAWTMYRWEAVSHLAASDGDFYMIVISNMTPDGQPNTLPTNYTLSVSYSIPSLLNWDTPVWGYREVGNTSNPDAWVKLSPAPGDDEDFYALIKCPTTGDFDLYSYMIWPHDDSRPLLLNLSRERDGYDQKYVFLGGSEGDHYLKIDGLWGLGWFGVVTRYNDWTIDNDNILDRAKEVDDNEPIWSTLDQGRDRFDWYKVHLGFGEEIPRVDFTIKEGRWDVYNISFYNRAGSLVLGSYNTLTGDRPTDENPTTPTVSLESLGAMGEGFHYILVHAVDRWMPDPGMPWEPAHCEYTLQFTLPNLPPERLGNIPGIEMDEDMVYTGLNLAKYFTDPDDHILSYSLGKKTTNLKVDVVKDTGKVTITPDMDWFGREKVVFRAIDDGPGSKYVEASTFVKVNPVNDPPKLVPGRTITNLTLNESEVAFADVLSTIFTDPDNDPNNPLTYTLKIVSKELTPQDAVFPLPFYNGTMDAFEVGPIDLMFGNITLKVTADDNNGSLQDELPTSEFTITVVHKNHAPQLLPGVEDNIEILLIEGERNDTFWVNDLIEDKDVAYAGDDLTFIFSGQMNVDAYIREDGMLVFDSSVSEFFPGQNYQEEIVLRVEDLMGEEIGLTFDVIVTPLDGPPVFRSFVPSEDVVTVMEGQRIEFKVVVDDDDTLLCNLNFTWYINKIEQRNENCSFFTYLTDYTSADGLDRTLRVLVSDGVTEISHSWVIRVEDVDRPPENVAIENPTNASVFKKGKTVNFVGKGIDLDGDDLAFIWYDGTEEIGRGSSFNTKGLKPGFHTVRLVVSDGTNMVETVVVFEIKKDRPDTEATPGFEAVFVLVAIAVVAVARAYSRSRRRWSS